MEKQNNIKMLHYSFTLLRLVCSFRVRLSFNLLVSACLLSQPTRAQALPQLSLIMCHQMYYYFSLSFILILCRPNEPTGTELQRLFFFF